MAMMMIPYKLQCQEHTNHPPVLQPKGYIYFNNYLLQEQAKKAGVSSGLNVTGRYRVLLK